MSNNVPISAEAALRETMELAAFYRNRNLLLAEELAVLNKELAQVKAELEALRPPLEGDVLPAPEEVH